MSCKNIIMQGDQYSITININFNNEVLDINTVDSIQFQVGNLIKYYKSDGSGQVTYDNENHCFVFPLTEEETFNFNGPASTQIRIKGVDGSIIGQQGESINLIYSNNKEVM